ncbi:MAG: hypothetical protein CMO01_10720 [Thalassobius sp.]|nr:hypothetical protein [Thalassovita sp.]
MSKVLNLFIAFAFAAAFVSCENKKTGVSEETTAVSSSESAPKTEASKAEADKKYANFEFEETVHDFGTIAKGEVVKHVFKFKNTGEAPLMISDIKTTCGCTTPQYTKDPVGPGESGEILVQFNSAGKAGVINKRVTIYANVDGGTDVVSIKCKIDSSSEVDGPYKTQPNS